MKNDHLTYSVASAFWVQPAFCPTGSPETLVAQRHRVASTVESLKLKYYFEHFFTLLKLSLNVTEYLKPAKTLLELFSRFSV